MTSSNVTSLFRRFLAPAIGCTGAALYISLQDNKENYSNHLKRNYAFADDLKHTTYDNRGTLREFRRFYREEDKLGEGTFAVVKRGVNLSTKEVVAIKEICKQKSDEDVRANEVKMMEKVSGHPNLIGLHNVYESDDILYVVLDYADGGELFERIVQMGELSEHKAAKLFRDAVLGVKHLHDRNIAHLDIKPENLLLRTLPSSELETYRRWYNEQKEQLEKKKEKNATIKKQDSSHSPEGDSTQKARSKVLSKKRQYRDTAENNEEIVAIADFGLAIQDDNREFDICVGTPAYWAPEMVRREKFTLAVDMWALGCVLYILLCGCHPFDVNGDASEAQILAKVAKGEYDTTNAEYTALSDAAKDLIRHLLDPDPKKRYTANQVLEHPWLTTTLSKEPISRDSVTKLAGYRVLILIKTGMKDLLNQAEENLFNGLDHDKDGYISKEELEKGLKLVGFEVNQSEIDAFLELVDTDRDQMISRQEFQAILGTRFDNEISPQNQHASLDDLSTLFKAYDRDGDGYISADDVYHVLTLLGTSTTRSVVQDKWSSLTGDELITFAQFVKYIRETERGIQRKKTVARVSSVMKPKDHRDLLRSRG